MVSINNIVPQWSSTQPTNQPVAQNPVQQPITVPQTWTVWLVKPTNPKDPYIQQAMAGIFNKQSTNDIMDHVWTNLNGQDLALATHFVHDVQQGSGLDEMINAYGQQWWSPSLIQDSYQKLQAKINPQVQWQQDQGGQLGQWVVNKDPSSLWEAMSNAWYNLTHMFAPWQWQRFSDIAMNEFWATPSVVWWALGAAWDIPSNVISFGWKVVWGIWNALWVENDLWNQAEWVANAVKMSTLLDQTWIKKDWWYNAGKIATEIWSSAIWAEALLWGITNGTQLWELLTQYPWIAKWIAKPILAGIWYQASQDVLNKWDVSSPAQYTTSAWLWLWAGIVGNVLWGLVSTVKDAPTFIKNAVKNMTPWEIDQIANDTKQFRDVPWSMSPIQSLTDKIDEALHNVQSDRWVVWSNIWQMRSAMKIVPANPDETVSTINKYLKTNNIAATITKGKKWYQLVWAVAKSEGQGTILKELVAQLNWLSQVGMKGNLGGVDKINQYIKYLMKISKMDGSLKNALSKAVWDFTSKIDYSLWDYWVANWQYAKLSNLKSDIEAISSEWGTKWQNLLRKISNPEWAQETQQLLKKLKYLWYTDTDLLWHTISTNYVMDNILWKWTFKNSLENIRPSAGEIIRTGLKWAKEAIVDPVEELKKAIAWYEPKMLSESKIWEYLPKEWVGTITKPQAIKFGQKMGKAWVVKAINNQQNQ